MFQVLKNKFAFVFIYKLDVEIGILVNNNGFK